MNSTPRLPREPIHTVAIAKAVFEAEAAVLELIRDRAALRSLPTVEPRQEPPVAICGRCGQSWATIPDRYSTAGELFDQHVCGGVQ